jgi:endonuclease/exonuclease/phosphatase family metal-dependent hydrolase
LALAVTVLAAACSSDPPRPRANAQQTAGTPARVRVVTLNVLHGTACPADSDHCRIGDRMALLAQVLQEADCPEAVALQEANREVVERLKAPLANVCAGKYAIVYDDDPAQDREAVLTTLPVRGSQRIRLPGPLRTAFWVRLDAPVGALDLVATHLASSSDDRPCDPSMCSLPCHDDDTLNTCQARMAARFLARKRDVQGVGVLVGDLNAKPGEPTVAALKQLGFVDAYLAGGNPECDPNTGTGCTSGRVDDTLVDLTNPASREQERIDYVFMAASDRCRVVAPTGLFGAAPAAAGPGGLAYLSDHTGVEATISCRTTAEERAVGKVDLPSTPTTGANAFTVPADARAAVTKAFDSVFGNQVQDPEKKLAYLEGGDALRASFLARYKSIGDVAKRTGVQILSMEPDGEGAVKLVFSITLDGKVVLDQLPGGAIRVDGRWLVQRGTYCAVATIGTKDVPKPCQVKAPGT